MSGSSNEQFLPESQMRAILTRDNVQAELDKCKTASNLSQNTNLAAVVDFILEKAEKTFATVVLEGNCVELIHLLYSTKYGDVNMPFEVSEFKKAIKKGLKGSPMFGDTGWKTAMLEKLEPRIDNLVDNTQYYLMAPVFDPSTFKYNLLPKTPLPFLPLDANLNSSDGGGFGEVKKRLLHRDHLNLKGAGWKLIVRLSKALTITVKPRIAVNC